MRPPLLVQPAALGRISGGYLYNARMAAGGLWETLDIAVAELPTLRERIEEARPVLMDSIWLTPEHASVFLDLQARGHRVGMMLHSFPSMIEATENGREPMARPSAFELDALEQLNVVVVPGSHYRDLLAGARATIVVAEPGIDDAWRARPRRRNGPCRLVSVGAVTPRKGFLDVLEVLHARSNPKGDDFTWSAAGSLEVDPSYAQRVADLCRRVPSATLHGQLTPEATRHLVQQSDLFLMPSYDENQPLVLLEAMAASVPSVVYAAGAARHMLEHGRQGFVTDIGDKDTFGRHVFQLLEDEQQRYAMALACWERQQSLPNWPTAARQGRAELQRVLS
jgi:glycosyltransferase involved in cell wall biosynthesis